MTKEVTSGENTTVGGTDVASARGLKAVEPIHTIGARKMIVICVAIVGSITPAFCAVSVSPTIRCHAADAFVARTPPGG